MSAKSMISEDQKIAAEEQIRSLRKKSIIIRVITLSISLYSNFEMTNFIFQTNTKGNIFGIMQIKIVLWNLSFWACLFPSCFSLIPRMGGAKS